MIGRYDERGSSSYFYGGGVMEYSFTIFHKELSYMFFLFVHSYTYTYAYIFFRSINHDLDKFFGFFLVIFLIYVIQVFSYDIMYGKYPCKL
jgi:hypothetical protein